MFASLKQMGRVFRTTTLSIGVVVTGGSAAWLAHSPPPATQASTPTESNANNEKILRIEADRMLIPKSIADRLSLQTEELASKTNPATFPAFQGCLALDSNSLQRVRSRFPGEVVELGDFVTQTKSVESTSSTLSTKRPLQVGDSVVQGQLLAVVWSKDLGEKKSELIDAMSKFKADEQVVLHLRELYRDGGTPERMLRDAERNLEADRVAVQKAERTLKSWRLTDADLAGIRAEADQLSDPSSKKSDSSDWARVEIRASQPGIVLEKNISVGDIVDTTNDLFKIGDLSHLTVWAHVYEDDLPMLSKLPKPTQWTISLPGQQGKTFEGTLENISSIIDPNQHTALVSGRVDNSKHELRIGQFVNVSVSKPSDSNVQAVPTQAVIEDGRESVVFVQSDLNRLEYKRCVVQVSMRTRERVYLKRSPDLNDGSRVVVSGAILLKEALSTLPISNSDKSVAAR